MKGPPFSPGSFPLFAKGNLKLLVLSVLRERPMHGYEVIKTLEERSHGFYKPSAGAVYPALRALLRKEYVSVMGEERRKTYSITSAGEDLLKRREEEVMESLQHFESALGPQRAGLFRELRRTFTLLRTNMPQVTARQADELKALVVRFRERMMSILAKGEESEADDTDYP